MARPSQALIDLVALRHNYRLCQSLAPNTQNLAVIKANAYGHGAVATAKYIEPLVPAFGVACIDEALELRDAGIRKPVLLLGGFFSNDELAAAAEKDFWLMVENQRQIDTLIKAKLSRPITTWLKVDTGMHRLGIDPESAIRLYQNLNSSSNIKGPVILATHFACADELNNPFTQQQHNRLQALATILSAPMSMANSPALLGWPTTHAAWNRPGYMLYGASPFQHPHSVADQLKPVMTFTSSVMSVRQVKKGESVGYGAAWQAQSNALIATIPVGYGDGYPRNAPSGTPVLINGRTAPLAGRVSMDLITVDVTNLNNIEPGAEVELWGKSLSVNEVAKKANTIGYELLTRMPSRLTRVYLR